MPRVVATYALSLVLAAAAGCVLVTLVRRRRVHANAGDVLREPATGVEAPAREQVPLPGDAVVTDPLPRELTVGRLPSQAVSTSCVATPAQPAVPVEAHLALEDLAALLERLWSERDCEALAALGDAHPQAAAIAYALAGCAAAADGEPRADGWFLRSHLAGELDACALAQPFLGVVEVPYALAPAHARLSMPLSSAAVAVRVAHGEIDLEDGAGALALLLDLPGGVDVYAARLRATLAMGWHTRAAQTADEALAFVPDAPPFLLLLAARAFAASGAHGRAGAVASDAALGAEATGHFEVANAARFLAAQQALAAGDTDSAWDQLMVLVRLAPPFPGARELLKQL